MPGAINRPHGRHMRLRVYVARLSHRFLELLHYRHFHSMGIIMSYENCNDHDDEVGEVETGV